MFYSALDIVSSKKVEDEDRISSLEKSLENITPHVEVRSRRIGGSCFSDPSTSKRG